MGDDKKAWEPVQKEIDAYYMAKGLRFKCCEALELEMDSQKGDLNKKVDPMEPINEHFNKDIGYKGEWPNTNFCASARGIARLGAFMAHKGSF